MSEEPSSSALHPAADALHDHEAPSTWSAGLALVATPIGNLGDITLRAIQTLREADLILCEDTRLSARVLAAHGIKAPTTPLHDHNEAERIPALLAQLQAGRKIALISDAGTPLMSDPGFRLTRAAIAAGLPITALPGANAAVMALTLSGLPPAPFLFLGFPPPRSAARRQAFAPLLAAEQAGLRATLIWYEAPHRLLETLDDLRTVFGNRPAAVARELSKRFEELRRGPISALIAHFTAVAPRGEIVVLLGPATDGEIGEQDLDALLRAARQTHSAKDAAALVATATGLPRKLVYRRLLDLDGSAAGDDSG